MVDLAVFRWHQIIEDARQGNVAPLADALETADPATVPREALVIAADALRGKLPPKKKRSDRRSLTPGQKELLRALYSFELARGALTDVALMRRLKAAFKVSEPVIRRALAEPLTKGGTIAERHREFKRMVGKKRHAEIQKAMRSRFPVSLIDRKR